MTLLETGNAKEGPEEGEGVGEEDGVVAVGHVEDALWWVSDDDEILFRCQNAQILARPDVEAPNLAVVGGCQRQGLHAHHVRRRGHQIYRQVDVLQHHTDHPIQTTAFTSELDRTILESVWFGGSWILDEFHKLGFHLTPSLKLLKA